MTRHGSATAQTFELENEPDARGSKQLSPALLYRRFKPLFRPRPVVYWTDMLGSALVGWTGLGVFLVSRGVSSVGMLGLLVAVLGLYRAVLFIHELCHLKHGALHGFETAWNVFVGAPLMVPSLMYVGTHADHHRRAQFATEEDPEYDPIAYWDPVRIGVSFLLMLAVPALLAARWGILGPLSYAFPSLRRRVVERASSLVINPAYRRRQLKPCEVRQWAWQEALAALWLWAIGWAAASGHIPAAWLWKAYLVPAGILVINHARTLVAHRYCNDAGLPMDRVGQLRDSVNLTGGSWLTPLAAPVGLRYHALHHLLPALPYHSLGAVHRTLERELPADSPYRETSRQGVLVGLRDLLSQARRHARISESHSVAG